MSARTIHRTLSCRIHNRFWRDKDQSLCSRAYYMQFADWRWRCFRVAMDLVFRPGEGWGHCRRSFFYYW